MACLQGMQTYVSTNYVPEGNAADYPAAANEKWGYFPNDKPVKSCLRHLCFLCDLDCLLVCFHLSTIDCQNATRLSKHSSIPT